MHPRAYIFDLDGTLVDSLRDIADALNRALADHGLPSAPLDRVRGWVGGGLRTLCQRACEPAAPDIIERVIASAEMHYRERVVVHTRLYPNIMQMLDLLKERGAKLAVLSNKPHALTVEVIHQLGIAPFFAEVRGPVSELERKPAPDGALAILGRLGVPAHDAFMVGDSSIDIETARNAGMISVGVSWGFRPVEEILAAGADFLVSDPLEIISLEPKKSR
jgi:phosphoglycolate phosphatase